jgi:hypothetical protein
MFQMLYDATRLFIRGKLFRDPVLVVRLWAIGMAWTTGAMLALFQLGAPLWVALTLPAFGGGMLQPWLFRDVKFN